MAQRFTEQAEAQVNPTFQAQTQALQAQIPDIQKLFAGLSSGLEQQGARQLQTGVRDIVEDASARGVLRSTLPVDARQDFQSQLSGALAESLGRLNLEQGQQIGNVNQQIGDLGRQRLGAVTSLADSLQQQDLRERNFAAEEKARQQDFDLRKQELALRARSSGGEVSRGEVSNRELFASALATGTGSDGKTDPGTYNTLKNQFVSAGYGTFKEFHDTYFNQFANPDHWWDYV